MLAELHAAILEDLDADGPRLVLADALQRVGDPRGELISIQCELARLGCDRTRVALWKSPDIGRASADTTRRADWIGDAFASADRDTIAKLRRREKALLALHEGTWIGAPLSSYRFGRGFVDHVRVGPKERLEDAYRVHLRSIELANAGAATLESSLLAQCRQLRVVLSHPTETFALIDRLGGVAPGASTGGVHGELRHLRELAVAGLTDLAGAESGRSQIGAIASALDRVIAAPAFGRLEALDLYNQVIDTPERIAQIMERAPLRELRLGLNVLTAGIAGSQTSICSALAGTAAASRLEVLDLFYAGTDGALIALCGSPHLQQLRALRIVTGSANRTYDDGGARAIGDALPELRVLDLRYSPLNRFVRELLSGRGLRRLAHLGLRSCSLDDTSARILADCPRLDQLRMLDLRDNLITDKGAAALAARGPGRFELLQLGGNLLTVKGRDLLNARFPEARIEIGRPRK